MASLKSTLSCIGVNTNQDISVLRHLFGFSRSRVPSDPTGESVTISILTLINSLQGEHFHFNIIGVGRDLFSNSDIDDIDYAIFKTRNIYRAEGNLGVGRIEHFEVSSNDSNGLHRITSQSDAEDLTNDWSVSNNGIDVFVVHRITDAAGFVGLSPVPGPCDKDSKGMNGLIADKDRGADATARTMAHEIGHYLGLEHRNNVPDNLMCQTGSASSIRDSILLSNAQANTIDDHCSIQNGCS